ncbi:restriction endonuclease [Janibacter melonis]|uniref:hypothetical protein n=1 Tax=Janibacter melonis TaxID=262209 RepID=UPI00204348A3|nr:hypothetical protein [Janibacter melonis]MCM3556368.1 restriction endonuclease [Janibacter melonis]
MKSLEERLLKATNDLLSRAADELFATGDLTDARLSVLEVVASLHAGWTVEEYWAHTREVAPAPAVDPGPWAEKVLESVTGTEIPVPLALAALSREVLPPAQQRKTGAYYTDWRLAQMLAGASVPQVKADGPWVDPACGSGILLVAAVMAVNARERDALIRDRLCGADLAEGALRGALLSVASLATDLESVVAFQRRLMCADSLRSGQVWNQLAPDGFALVIGNPPWERLRTSRHEVAAASGKARHYGQSFDAEVDLSESRSEMLDYLERVVTGTRLQGKGEHDLYKLFLELGLAVSAEDGIVAQLVPAGLIRSQGTETLRRELDALSRDLQLLVLENRQRHFAIDSRFKFLAVVGRVGDGRRQPIALRVADRTGRLPDKAVKISRAELLRVRADLSVPEVRTDAEWELFARLSREGISVGDKNGPWRPCYRRELDMTSDQRNFERTQAPDALPVIEGRHIAQFRNRAKAYRSGEGRAALWEPLPLGRAALTPQWFIRPERLKRGAKAGAARSRVGFCDITGQTNERSLLVARVPAGVVCGNKVPTLTFPEGGADREDLFVALANSFAVDWVVRRLITTTVNFFLLDSVPLPPITEDSPTGAELVELTRLIAGSEGSAAPDLWQVAQWRARADALVAAAWGITVDDMRLVLDDFPLIDRGQPPLAGEPRSTVTVDLVLATLAELLDESAPAAAQRVQNARGVGATPYIPAEYA